MVEEDKPIDRYGQWMHAGKKCYRSNNDAPRKNGEGTSYQKGEVGVGIT